MSSRNSFEATRRTRTSRRLGLACAAALACALTTTAADSQAQEPAQAALPLNRFNPSWAGDRFFAVASPHAAGHLDFHGMLVGDYAHNPLVLRRVDADGEERVGSIVEHQLFLHLNASFSLWNRLAINVNAPIALFQDGDDPAAGGTSFTSPSGAQFGDIRVGLRGRLFGEYDDPFQIAIGGYLWVPSGPSDAGSYVGNGTVRGMPQLVLGGVVDRFVYSAEAGPEFRQGQSITGIAQGHMFNYGAGVGVLLGEERRVQLGLELTGALVFEDVQQRTTNLEMLGGVKWRFVDDFVAGIGAGPGITSGVGTPDFRGVLSIAYSPDQTPEKAPSDRDGDGIYDADDACPDKKGPRDPDPKMHGCPPPPDSDGDGIIDAEDACPEVAGVKTDDPATHGCPPKVEPPPVPKPSDADGDGIIDDEDACPNKAGVPNQDKTQHGCPKPLDSDGDGILDKDDACKDQPGVKDKDPNKHGCPKVVVTDSQIVILERVEFDTGKATIRPVSNDILDAVAKVMKEHPEIEIIEVQGHTDNQGSRYGNKILSQARATAVMKALVKRGIDKKRLTAKGYGQDKPVADNSTPEGRQDNRRVQFDIIKKAKK